MSLFGSWTANLHKTDEPLSVSSKAKHCNEKETSASFTWVQPFPCISRFAVGNDRDCLIAIA